MPVRNPHRKTRTTLVCPKCNGGDIDRDATLFTGFVYRCKSCGYVGSLILEKEVDDRGTQDVP